MSILRYMCFAVIGIATIVRAPLVLAHSDEGEHEVSPALQSYLAALEPGAVLQGGKIVDCTLSGGTQTKCMRFILQAAPKREPGPWCPSRVTDGAEAGRFWIDDGKVYDVDGEFVRNLATFYDDPTWQLYDPETGEIKVTTSFDGCFAAARPDVPKAYYNYCVQCEVDQVVAAPSATFFIPLMPVKADSPSPLLDQPGAGVGLNGVRFNGPAPYDDIMRAYNLAPFDDCGGHVNPYHGYHYHFVTDCVEKISAIDGHAPQVGISVDGYGIYQRLDGGGQRAARARQLPWPYVRRAWLPLSRGADGHEQHCRLFGRRTRLRLADRHRFLRCVSRPPAHGTARRPAASRRKRVGWCC